MSSQKKTNLSTKPKDTQKMPQKSSFKAFWRHTVKVFRVIDKGLDLGVRIFDYVVKVSKVAALFLGATTAVYVAKEIPNRSETDTMGDVVERAVGNMGRDMNRVVNQTCPRSSRPRPNRNEGAKNMRPKTDARKSEAKTTGWQKTDQMQAFKITTQGVPFYLQDWQNIR